MSTQISAPIKIVALIGLLASLAMGAWTFTAGRATTTSSADVGTAMSQDIAAAKSVATKLDAHNRAAPGAKTRVAPAARAAAPAAAAPKQVTHTAKPDAVKAPDGTPTTIASALSSHRVVVVLLVDPQSKIDSYSVGEARRGASRSHAGFFLVNVLRESQAAAFAGAYGVQSSPTVLFFARPGKLVQTLPGFADSQTVAQAAMNAAQGIVVPQG